MLSMKKIRLLYQLRKNIIKTKASALFVSENVLKEKKKKTKKKKKKKEKN